MLFTGFVVFRVLLPRTRLSALLCILLHVVQFGLQESNDAVDALDYVAGGCQFWETFELLIDSLGNVFAKELDELVAHGVRGRRDLRVVRLFTAEQKVHPQCGRRIPLVLG